MSRPLTDREARNLAAWSRLFRAALPFADAASPTFPLSKILQLSLFQVAVGMAAVLLTGTLNRVMIVELGLSTSLVAAMVAIPLLAAPFRALVGYRSDTYRSYLGWRRAPYLFFGGMMQFGGFAILPFALLILAGDGVGPEWIGAVAAAGGFLLVGAGMHTVQTAGLALATDLAPEAARPRVVALLYVMLLVGMLISALGLGALLAEFNPRELIQIIQGVAVASLLLVCLALWKMEPRNPALTDPARPRPSFRDTWEALTREGGVGRLLVAVGLGAAAFSMQDVLLEPYGAEILGLDVGATTLLTALWAGGALCGFALAAHRLTHGAEPHRLAAWGAMAGVVAFSAVIFAAPLGSGALFRLGALGIGFGGGLFSVGVLTAAMNLAERTGSGLALGAWGAVQATAAGLAIGLGGVIRDVVGHAAMDGRLGVALANPATGYSVVYHLEIGLLFAALIALGPLAAHAPRHTGNPVGRFGLAELPT